MSYYFIQSREIVDRGSLFIANICSVTSDKDTIAQINQIAQAKYQLRQSRNSEPTHSITAYRYLGLKPRKSGLSEDDFTLKSGYDDDGEKYAGKRILEQITTKTPYGQTIDALIVVSRWYGGQMLGPIRFEHIKNLCKEVCDEMRNQEELREKVNTLTSLDDNITELRSKLGMENKSQNYDNLDNAKAERLIKARRGTLDVLKKKLSNRVDPK
ncbi:ribosomal protein S5 domain 2-like protein [Wallemia mellicola CBS 633.66]|uniref:Ribosomal protein S5 domain 2-like protein n=1 Tax=Wallemia mellicola (strain ATCC MYA-4683 / CBS 633.66) TaxID=671144 RepID=I4YJP8_WALMC|nr:ribosomal protein S5 domain 2-like protein [Wallemia mellicola CBS 633.66]EIM24190.1 ribosomal protein S5 domain 2-like protein [Wallemia mellicola CBS 633.66]|eukprot:XP_006956010.1 ribosomal protein S5 domain 2-like protein [Wallemia mellicola CBS 633.66]